MPNDDDVFARTARELIAQAGPGFGNKLAAALREAYCATVGRAGSGKVPHGTPLDALAYAFDKHKALDPAGGKESE